MHHTETKFFPYKTEDIFALITDIEAYPEFLPWCAAVRIVERDDTAIVAEMVVRYKGLSERFVSRVTTEPNIVDVKLVEGPFSHLHNQWKLTPMPEGTQIDFIIDFSFRSAMLEKLMGYFFHSAFTKMVSAFEARAKEKCVKIA